MLHLALYQPDIPQNTGSLMRLCACVGVRLHIIEPCGFLLDAKQIKRVAMDYGVITDLHRHSSWENFLAARAEQGIFRLILLSTKASDIYTNFKFAAGDCLLLGRESAGVPEDVANTADGLIKIPMREGARSLNVAMAASMVIGEAIRQVS
jgi:tRNA (cytidine/uridine-2'-O-)-methyltransferase